MGNTTHKIKEINRAKKSFKLVLNTESNKGNISHNYQCKIRKQSNKKVNNIN